MKANELRIGNIVYPFDDIDLVDESTIIRDCIIIEPKDFEDTNHLQPITLTEEWLVKFGVKRTTGYNEKGIAMLYLKTDYFEVECSFTYIMYIHSLQNLYFALTGEELNFVDVK